MDVSSARGGPSGGLGWAFGSAAGSGGSDGYSGTTAAPAASATTRGWSGTSCQPSSSLGSLATTTPDAVERQVRLAPQAGAAIAVPAVTSRFNRPPPATSAA